MLSLLAPPPAAPAPWSREQSALLGFVRAPLSSDEAASLRARCEEGLDWDEMVRLAADHRVLPLLFWNAQALGWPGVPDVVRARLANSFHLSASRTFALARELIRVGHLLDEHGIPMAPLKGATLAAAAYGSVALRQFGDLDLLVPRGDVLRAREALFAGGYRLRVDLAPAQEEAHLRDDSVFDLMREGSNGEASMVLELHWAVTARCFARPITFAHVQSRLHRAPLAGGSAHFIEPADLLVILCVHGTKHLWERLQWIVDISQMLRLSRAAHSGPSNGSGPTMEPLDWKRVRGLAARFEVERMVALGLVVAHEVLGAPVPTDVLAWARGVPQAEVLAAQVRVGLFAQRSEEPEMAEAATLTSSRFLLRAMDSWGDRARFAWHVATTPPAEERAAIVLPGPLERLRPVVRSARLAALYIAHARAARRRV